MPDSEDYRKYLDEKFNGINVQFNGVNNQFNGVNSRLDTIEKKVDDLVLKDAIHGLTCPQIPNIKKIEDDLDKYKESQADLNWIQKHPGLAIRYASGVIVVLVLGFFGVNKIIPSKGENTNKALIETKFQELEKKNDVIEQKLLKQNAYYETVLTELKNKNEKKPQN